MTLPAIFQNLSYIFFKFFRLHYVLLRAIMFIRAIVNKWSLKKYKLFFYENKMLLKGNLWLFRELEDIQVPSNE